MNSGQRRRLSWSRTVSRSLANYGARTGYQDAFVLLDTECSNTVVQLHKDCSAHLAFQTTSFWKWLRPEEAYYNMVRVDNTRQMIYKEDHLLNGVVGPSGTYEEPIAGNLDGWGWNGSNFVPLSTGHMVGGAPKSIRARCGGCSSPPGGTRTPVKVP